MKQSCVAPPGTHAPRLHEVARHCSSAAGRLRRIRRPVVRLWPGGPHQEAARPSAACTEKRMSRDMASLFAERESERYALHTRYLNEQLVRVLKTIGYDV